MSALLKSIAGWELVVGIVGGAILLEVVSVGVWLAFGLPGVPLIGGLVGAIGGIFVGRRLKRLNQRDTLQ